MDSKETMTTEFEQIIPGVHHVPTDPAMYAKQLRRLAKMNNLSIPALSEMIRRPVEWVEAILADHPVRCVCGGTYEDHNYSGSMVGHFYECWCKGHQPQTGPRLVFNCKCEGYVEA